VCFGGHFGGENSHKRENGGKAQPSGGNNKPGNGGKKKKRLRDKVEWIHGLGWRGKGRAKEQNAKHNGDVQKGGTVKTETGNGNIMCNLTSKGAVAQQVSTETSSIQMNNTRPQQQLGTSHCYCVRNRSRKAGQTGRGRKMGKKNEVEWGCWTWSESKVAMGR